MPTLPTIKEASHLRCLCQAINEPTSLLKSATLPITTEICHCNTCRHTSGALCPAFVALKTSPPSASLDRCTKYGTRYFCTTCGCRTFDTSKGSWFACSGMVEPPCTEETWGGNVIKITSHDYVSDTVDGGLAYALHSIDGRVIPCFPHGRDGEVMTSEDLTALHEKYTAQTSTREEALLAACHCEAIRFYILPPDAYPSQLDSNRGRNVHPSIAKWLRADNTKYLGLHCACNYCRRASGFSFASNIYVMPENIVLSPANTDTEARAEGEPARRASLFGYSSDETQISDFEASTVRLKDVFPALRFDLSSPGVRRSWCGVCGASVFFERDSRPQCVNVAVGLLRAKSGALAQGWVEFGSEVWWKQYAVDHEIVRALEMEREV